MKNRNLIFGIVFSILSMTSCSKSDSSKETPPVPPEYQDRTFEVLSKVSGQSFRLGNTSLGFSDNGTFELLLDADVRYFSSDEDVKSRESDARCLVKISGTATFVYKPNMFVIPVNAGVEFVVDSATVISSAILRSDLSTVAPADVCSRYVDELKQTKNFKKPLFDYGSNYMAFVGLDFNILNPSSKNRWLFNSQAHENGIYERSTVHRKNFEYVYLVKPNTQVDVTSMVLADLDGQYIQSSYREGTSEVTVSAKQSQILLSHPTCGLIYRIDVASAYFDSETLRAKLVPIELGSFSTKPTASEEECAMFKNTIQKFEKPVQLRYFTHSEANNKEPNYMRFIFESDNSLSYSELSFKSK